MIPLPGQTLTDIATRVATHLMPALDNDFAQADAGLIAGLLLTLAQDYERAVYNPMADIDEIKALCTQLLALPAAELEQFDQADTCREFLDAQPASLRLADVNALHAQALDLLIEIHAWAEQHHEAINLEAWRLLRRHSERHKLDFPGP